MDKIVEVNIMRLWEIPLAAIFVGLIYILFFWKISWIRPMDPKKNEHHTTVGLRKMRGTNPVYPNGWFVILESFQLKKGHVKNVTAIGETFAVYRTNEGNVHVLDAYCPHLGANMAEGGKVIGNCLQCPFHHWSFGPDGQCKSIPYSEKIPSTAKVRSWKNVEVNNYIFVWYHAEGDEPHWYPEPIPEITDKSYWCQGRNEYYINCHIQEIPENGADWAHLTALHARGMVLDNLLPGLSRHSWTDAKWQPGSGDAPRPTSYRAVSALKHALVLFGKIPLLEMKVTADQIGPGYVELTLNAKLGKLIILQTVTPVEPFVIRVTHSLYSAPLNAFLGKVVFLGECAQFERDVRVWNHKEFLKNPLIVPEDKKIKEFRRWYKQFYSPNSPTYQSIRSLDW